MPLPSATKSDPVLVLEQLDALQRCLKVMGTAKFLAYFMWILPKDSVLMPFKPNAAQTDIGTKLSGMDLVLKARQMGFTTYMILERLLLKAVTQTGFRGLFVSQKMFYAQQHFMILDRARRTFAMTSPRGENPVAESLAAHLLRRKLGNRREILFENIDSMVIVDSAQNSEAGQGFCASPQCLLPTFGGAYKRFGDVQVGDTLIGDDGTPVRVSHVHRIPAATHRYKGQTYRVQVVGTPSVAWFVAPNHPFETQRGMVEAKDLTKQDYIAYPHRKLDQTLTHVTLPQARKDAAKAGRRMRLTRQLGFVCGFYLADGFAVGKTAIKYAMMNPRKIDECEPILDKFFAHFNGGHEMITATGKRYKQYSSSVFNRWIRENFGYAKHKHFPDWWQHAPKKFLEGLMHGLFSGDGDWGYRQGKNHVVLSTCNSKLALGTWQIVMALGWGVPGVWQKIRASKKVVIAGVVCTHSGERYKVSLFGDCYERYADATGAPFLALDFSKRFRRSQFYAHGKHYVRVQKSVPDNVIPEYVDITVDNSSHKYLSPVGITHNTINGFVGSEFSRWPGNPAETLANIRGSLAPGAAQVLECTANGAAGPFYEYVTSAMEGKGVFKLHFYPWWWDPGYRLPLTSEQRMELALSLNAADEIIEQKQADKLSLAEREENAVVKRALLDLEQVAWRRSKVAEDPRRFRENFAEDEQTAFLTEGGSFFDNEIIGLRKLELKNFVPYRKGRRGEVVLFFPPSPNTEYLIGADVAEGMAADEDGNDLDYSCAFVIDLRTGEQVAQYRAHTRPDQYATDLAELGKMYNNAVIAVERNSFGLATILFLERDEMYPNLYRHPEIAEADEASEKLGFPTNVSTRPTALSYLLKWTDENPNMIWSELFCKEALQFFRGKNGKPQAQKGAHDDSIAAMWIAMGARAYMLGFWIPVRRNNPDDV